MDSGLDFEVQLEVVSSEGRDSGVSLRGSKVFFPVLKKIIVRGSWFLLFGGRAMVIVSILCVWM